MCVNIYIYIYIYSNAGGVKPHIQNVELVLLQLPPLLNLSNCSIIELESFTCQVQQCGTMKGPFTGMSGMKSNISTIDLSHNELFRIRSNALYGVFAARIDLCHNNIMQYSYGWTGSPLLGGSQIYTAGNPSQCDTTETDLQSVPVEQVVSILNAGFSSVLGHVNCTCHKGFLGTGAFCDNTTCSELMVSFLANQVRYDFPLIIPLFSYRTFWQTHELRVTTSYSIDILIFFFFLFYFLQTINGEYGPIRPYMSGESISLQCNPGFEPTSWTPSKIMCLGGLFQVSTYRCRCRWEIIDGRL